MRQAFAQLKSYNRLQRGGRLRRRPPDALSIGYSGVGRTASAASELVGQGAVTDPVTFIAPLAPWDGPPAPNGPRPRRTPAPRTDVATARKFFFEKVCPMQIGDLECATGQRRDTLRFYKKSGLVRSRRLANGYRDYPSDSGKAARSPGDAAPAAGSISASKGMPTSISASVKPSAWAERR